MLIFIDSHNFNDMSAAEGASSLYTFGTVIYTLAVFTACIKIGYIESGHWTLFTHLFFVITLIFWWSYQYTYSMTWKITLSFGYSSAGIWDIFVSIQLLLWTVLLLVVVTNAMVCDFTLNTFKMVWHNTFYPVQPREDDDENMAVGNYGRAVSLFEMQDGNWIKNAILWFRNWEKHHEIRDDVAMEYINK